jgi:hypothetical protein
MSWEDWEGGDFYLVTRGEVEPGRFWIGLVCSVCGNVQACAEGPTADLGGFGVAAQFHFEQKHQEGQLSGGVGPPAG